MKLQGEQEVFYFLSGKGTMTAGGEAVDVYEGISILAPAGLEFTLKNTGERELTMYLISEPTLAGFRPNQKLLVKDEGRIPVRSSSGHWAHIVKGVFESKEGLASLGNVLTVALDPMTIGEPHAHGAGSEEVWAAIKGESLAFIGTQLRWQRPGMAYLVPPGEPATLKSVAAGLSFPHSNINSGKEQVKFLYFSRLEGGRRPAADSPSPAGR
ncbi:MAG TPA: cupin domain-containing protein [Bryobacteraceae bacterium]|nr:cupin domain-containing protein [Bryobacteraceae bacterium]